MTELAAGLTSHDSTHWWLPSQATFVSLLMRRYAPKDGWLVEIGSGAAGMAAMLGWAPDRTLALKSSVELRARKEPPQRGHTPCVRRGAPPDRCIDCKRRMSP